jgi:hypothetical protein
MPYIPEEKIDQALAELVDMKEAVQIQTLAIGQLGDTLAIHGQWLAKIHDAVARKSDGDTLGDLLRALVAADQQQTAVLQQLLTAVQRLGAR